MDVFKEGGTNWTNLLGGANVPTIAYNSLGTLRSAIKQAMDNTGKDMKRDGGVDILQHPDREAVLNLLDQLAEYGVFVVPDGELESWVKQLGASGHGPSWLISVFERMGEDPEAAGFLMPACDDVWAFIQKMKAWLIDANRKGIPT